jgi:hypothetical protein
VQGRIDDVRYVGKAGGKLGATAGIGEID